MSYANMSAATLAKVRRTVVEVDAESEMRFPGEPFAVLTMLGAHSGLRL